MIINTFYSNRENSKNHTACLTKCTKETRLMTALNPNAKVFADNKRFYSRGYLFVSLWCEYLNFVQECDQYASLIRTQTMPQEHTLG